MRTKRANINDFITKTGVSMICGYRKQVDFIQSTAEELNFFYDIIYPQNNDDGGLIHKYKNGC